MARDGAKAERRKGNNPGLVKKQRRALKAQQNAGTFQAIATGWHQIKKPTRSLHHATEMLERCERDVFPRLGHIPIRLVGAPDLLAIIRAIKRKNPTDRTTGPAPPRRRELARFRADLIMGTATRQRASDLRMTGAGQLVTHLDPIRF